MSSITILGGGNGGHAMAAHAALEGYDVTLYEMPRFADGIETVLETGQIVAEGLVDGVAELDTVTTDIDEALDGAKHVCLVVPAFAHPDYADLLAGKMTEDQVLILYPGTLGSLEMRETFLAKDAEVPVILETQTLPYNTRLEDDGHVRVLKVSAPNVAVLPSELTDDVLEDLPAFLEFDHVYEDVLECGLNSVNPALHSGACVINIGPIEYWANGDFYLYEEGFVPSAAKLDKRLDEERNDVGASLGYEMAGFADLPGLDEDWGWEDLYRYVHGSIGLTPIVGPNDVHNRYLTEDAPYGLVPWSTIADQLGVETPLIDAIVNIYSVVHECDWWETGRTAAALGLEGMSAEEMREFVRTRQT